MILKQFEGQLLEELSMIEVAYAILETKGEAVNFNQLLEMIQDFLKLSDEQVERRMARFYTDLNVDGGFISLGDNRWALRTWYAIDEIDETTSNSEEDETTTRRRKKRKYNALADGDDVIDYNDDDPEDMDSDYEDSYADDDEQSDEYRGLSVVSDADAMRTIKEVEDDESDDSELDQYAADLSEFDAEDEDTFVEDEFEEDEEEDLVD